MNFLFTSITVEDIHSSLRNQLSYIKFKTDAKYPNNQKAPKYVNSDFIIPFRPFILLHQLMGHLCVVIENTLHRPSWIPVTIGIEK